LYILPQSYDIFVKSKHKQATFFPANQIFNDKTSSIADKLCMDGIIIKTLTFKKRKVGKI